MCSKPSIPQPKQFQQSRTPVFNTSGSDRGGSGRRGTILTGGTGLKEPEMSGKKTILGN